MTNTPTPDVAALVADVCVRSRLSPSGLHARMIEAAARDACVTYAEPYVALVQRMVAALESSPYGRWKQPWLRDARKALKRYEENWLGDAREALS